MGKVLKPEFIHTREENNSQENDYDNNSELSTTRGKIDKFSSFYQQNFHSLSSEGVFLCGL